MNKVFLIFIFSFYAIVGFTQQHPTNLISYNNTETSVDLGWTDNGCSNGFYLNYREIGASWIQIITGITNPYILTGLDSATTYEWRVQCAGVTGWSDVDTFSTNSACNKSIIQYVSDFTPDPVYGYMLYAYDTLIITSTANCDINLRPEFIISHQDSAIELGDFTIEWFNPLFGGFFAVIPYTIDANGNAVGFWNVSATDSTGFNLAAGSPSQQMLIRVRFMNPANNPNPTPTPYGTYTAAWSTFEVDTLGNEIQALAPSDTVSLSLVNCGIFTVTNSSSSDISCFGDNNGTASINTISNGSGSYSYTWNNGDSLQTISNLQAGNYHCTITDNNWSLCTTTESFTINEPTLLTASVTITDVNCNGDSSGMISISPSGGTGGYATVFSDSSQHNLEAGDYSFTVTDNNGCTFSDTVTVNEPLQITSNVSTTDVTSCTTQDGSINLTVNGGVGSYSYLWSNNEITQDLNNLSAGNYSVTITDSNNCTVFNSATINDIINMLSIDSLVTPINNGYNLLCHGDTNGSIISNISGGSGNITYSWSDGQSTANASNLIAGAYILTVSDTLGCIATDTLTLNEPLALFSFLSADTILCYNYFAYAEILVYGGASPFQYNWSNGTTNYFTNLYSGLHTIEVIDVNGCILLDTILISNPDSISLQASISDASCYGMQDAIVDINIMNGGTAPFLYSVNNGINNQLSSMFYNIGAGSYTYLVSDSNGCNNEIHLTVSQPDSLYSSFSLTTVSCYGECDGSAITSITGGIPPYTQDWGGAIASALCAGYYNVTITDFNGCIITDGVTITEPNPIIVNIWQNGMTIEATSGLNTYQWYDNAGNPIAGATTNILVPTTQGEYYVQVTDSNGCSINSYSILFSTNIINENNSSVNIHPNPTNGKLIIECSEDYNTILVFNILGTTVYEIDNKFEKQSRKIIDLSSFEKGIYFIQIEVNNQLISQRIILQ